MNQDGANLISNTDFAFVSMEGKGEPQNSNLWVVNSGATCHMVCNDMIVLYWKRVTDEVVVADGNPLFVEKIGKI